MAKSAFGTIRRLDSGHYQAHVRLRGRQVTLGTYTTRREAAASIAAAGAESGRWHGHRPRKRPATSRHPRRAVVGDESRPSSIHSCEGPAHLGP